MVAYALQVSPSAAEGEMAAGGRGWAEESCALVPFVVNTGWNRQLQHIEGEQEYPPGAPESTEDLNTTTTTPKPPAPALQERPAHSLLGLNIPEAGKTSPTSFSLSLPPHCSPHLIRPSGMSLLW